jgi:Tfp pilus assembly protein PilO
MKINFPPATKRVLFLLLALLAIRLIWYPIVTWQEEAEARIAQLQKNLSKLESLEKNRHDLESALKSSEECIGNLQTYFHPDASTPEALQLEVQKSIEDLAGQNGLKVERMEWMYVNEDGLIIQTPLRIIFRATLSQAYNFIFQLETRDQLYTLDGIQLNLAAKGELHGTLEISAYNLVPKKEK